MSDGRGEGWRDRIVGHGKEAPEKLIPNEKNWRLHPERQKRALAGVLGDVGWVQQVVVNRRTGRLVDGHLRVALALERAETEVPVVYVDLDEREEALVLATLDPLAALADVDAGKLEALLREVRLDDPAVNDMLTELAKNAGVVLGEPEQPIVEVPAEIERAEELREKWQTARGQLWEIPSATVEGRAHRLLCGDSTAEADVARVLQGVRPFLMVTDPPYGVEYDPTWREKATGHRVVARGSVANDDRADWQESWDLFPGDVAYVWHAGLFAAEVLAGLHEAGFRPRAQIVWVKQHFVLSRGDYHWQHEPCWYAVRHGRPSHWAGDRAQATTWLVQSLNPMGGNRVEEKTGHGTQKPVELFARAYRNHEADEVYEPFAGSGTALVAAEQLRRICLGIEIEPKYVAVVLERLASMGLDPRLAGDG